MKITVIAMFILFGIASPVLADQGSLCSAINFCRVEKKTWGKKGWSSDYVKETKISSLCKADRPALQLEPQLGIELWLFDGNKASSDWLESRPHVTANLYTYKLTYVVASGSTSLNEPAIAFSHRLTPEGKTIVDVACFKK
jgi:hypothetical protein